MKIHREFSISRGVASSPQNRDRWIIDYIFGIHRSFDRNDLYTLHPQLDNERCKIAYLRDARNLMEISTGEFYALKDISKFSPT